MDPSDILNEEKNNEKYWIDKLDQLIIIMLQQELEFVKFALEEMFVSDIWTKTLLKMWHKLLNPLKSKYKNKMHNLFANF